MLTERCGHTICLGLEQANKQYSRCSGSVQQHDWASIPIHLLVCSSAATGVATEVAIMVNLDDVENVFGNVGVRGVVVVAVGTGVAFAPGLVLDAAFITAAAPYDGSAFLYITHTFISHPLRVWPGWPGMRRQTVAW